MSIQSRAVLHKIRKITRKTEYPLQIDSSRKIVHITISKELSFSYKKYEDELESILDYLVEQGNIVYLNNEHTIFRLKHKGIHIYQFHLKDFLQYLTDKWIDIVAITLSIIALFKSYGIDLLSPLIALCKKLLGQ